MADTYDTDEFGFPLRSLERLHLQQGGRLSEGNARSTDLPNRGVDLNEVGDLGFSRQDWLDAQFANYCFNIKNGVQNALS